MRCSQFRQFWTACVVTFSVINWGIADAYNQGNEHETFKLCGTGACQKAAQQLHNSRDGAVNACENFYKHACGRWMRNHDGPFNTIETQTDLVKANKIKRMIMWLNEAYDDSVETMRKVHDYYASCMNNDEIEGKELTPLKTILADNGGWPILLRNDDWNLTRTNLTWIRIHENYGKILRHTPLFHFAAHPNLNNNASYILHILPRDWYPLQSESQTNNSSPIVDEEARAAEINYVTRVARAIAKSQKSKVPQAQLKADAKKILEFEDALLTLYSTVPRHDTGVGHKYTIRSIADVQQMWDKQVSENPEYAINWLETIQNMFAGTGIEIEKTENIALSPDNVIEGLADVLKRFPLRTVVNYIHWGGISDLVPFTNFKMRMLVYDKTSYIEDNLRTDGPRRDVCYDEHAMTEGLAYVFVQNYFKKSPKMDVGVIVNEMKDELISKIENYPGLNAEVKVRSHEILETLLKNIGYPAWYDEPNKIDEYYSDLNVSRDNYFENVINYNGFHKRKMLKKLRKNYYTYEPTAMDIPKDFDAMNFQMPFYHPGRSLVAKYGVVGSLVGPLLARIFIDEGVMPKTEDEVDETVQQWTNFTLDRYKDKIESFLHQYHDIIHQSYINRTSNVRTIIADNIGFPLALEAYNSHKKHHNVTIIKEDGFSLHTDEELFFYALGNRFCETDLAATNHHWEMRISSEARVNGALSNMKEFADAFKCESGSPMNPETKNIFWE